MTNERLDKVEKNQLKIMKNIHTYSQPFDPKNTPYAVSIEKGCTSMFNTDYSQNKLQTEISKLFLGCLTRKVPDSEIEV